MASTEMIQKGFPPSPAHLSTPPNSLDLPQSLSFTLDDAHQFIDMVKAIVAMQIASTASSPHCACSDPLAKSPILQTPSPPVTLEHLEQLLLKLVQSKDSAGASDGAKPDTKSGDAQPKMARASKLEFKTVNEVWDKKEYKYKVEDSPESAEVNELDQYVFVVRVRIDRGTKEPTSYIDIKSEGLRDVLRKVLKGVRVSLGEDKPAVEQNLLYHYLPELESYPSMEHLDLLVDYLKKTYTPITKTLVSLLQSKEITYGLLWALFKSNSLVYTTCHGTGKQRCVKYDFGEEKESDGEKYFNLECRYLDFDGEKFGEASIQVKILKFLGTKPINALEAFPLQYHRDEKRVRADLIECGQKFVSLRGSHHRHCHGPAFYIKREKRVRVPINSRVMIDAAFFQEINPNSGTRPHVTEPQWVKNSSGEWYLSSESLSGPSSHQVKSIGIEPVKLKEDELLICCPTVPGFSLGDKLWVEFAVADISDITWSSLPFNCLTIPDEQREVIMALAEARMSRVPGATFDDFIKGKGQGLNILLHGPPGVGKTLTAEALSEHLKIPLYSISAGELSTNAAEMDPQISQIFQIASHWGAILLLDEADVFLERRSSQDLVRNGLVSVFLRKLEYCEGIMFLTTNRVSEFDEAILTRIHLMLRYDDLSQVARTTIWKHFLDRACTFKGPVEIKPEELNRLVTGKFNGRQIKNMVATAHALATRRKSRVVISHLREAVTASEKFIREFNGGEDGLRMFM